MKSFFVELKDFETVVVGGPDAAKFLQGQLTCDVHSLAENAFTHGAACNNKGRIFASFILARRGENYHVLLAHGLARIFVANLQKYIPFYKCTMQILTGLNSIGLMGITITDTLEKLQLRIPAANTASNDAGLSLYNLQSDNTQFILSAHYDNYAAIKSSIAASIPEGTRDDWELRNILSGHFPFTPEDVDKYTPQELHFDQVGYISFTKGCYTGQEIVARMHYRGKVKKRLYLLKIENFRNPENDNETEILDESGKNLGLALKEIVDDNNTLFAIASLPVELTATKLLTKDGQTFVYYPLTDGKALGLSEPI
jgi:folate-binding protein YgfZ